MYRKFLWAHPRKQVVGRQIKVRELHILSTVVQAGSMAKAAALLSMTQPTVSEAIANLEALLQVRLLDRNSRGVEPTIYAQALLKRGRVVLDELGQAVRDIEFLADPAGGEVRIGCPEAFSAGLVPAIIEQISRSHPQLAVHVVDANTAFLEFRQLRERNVDLMLGRISKALQDDDLNFEILFEEPLYVVAGAQTKWARRRQVALADLIGERWILAEPNHVVR
jgi:DNA-binding transcriptional LysR family regulator